MWNYNATTKDDFDPMTKQLLKKLIALCTSKCHRGSCPQMQTLASMYIIGEWILLSLQNHAKNVHYVLSYSQLNPYMRKNLL
jgi:hypothetical protein